MQVGTVAVIEYLHKNFVNTIAESVRGCSFAVVSCCRCYVSEFVAMRSPAVRCVQVWRHLVYVAVLAVAVRKKKLYLAGTI